MILFIKIDFSDIVQIKVVQLQPTLPNVTVIV